MFCACFSLKFLHVSFQGSQHHAMAVCLCVCPSQVGSSTKTADQLTGEVYWTVDASRCHTLTVRSLLGLCVRPFIVTRNIVHSDCGS